MASGKVQSIFVSEIKNTFRVLPTRSMMPSNLLGIELIFRCPIITFLGFCILRPFIWSKIDFSGEPFVVVSFETFSTKSSLIHTG